MSFPTWRLEQIEKKRKAENLYKLTQERISLALRLLRKQGFFARKVNGGGVTDTFDRRLEAMMLEAGITERSTATWIAHDTFRDIRHLPPTTEYINFWAPTEDEKQAVAKKIIDACQWAGLWAEWDGNVHHAVEVTLPKV